MPGFVILLQKYLYVAKFYSNYSFVWECVPLNTSKKRNQKLSLLWSLLGSLLSSQYLPPFAETIFTVPVTPHNYSKILQNFSSKCPYCKTEYINRFALAFTWLSDKIKLSVPFWQLFNELTYFVSGAQSFIET